MGEQMNTKCQKVLQPIFRTSALVAGLVSGYYHRVFAGTCSGAAGTYLCSGGANTATDTTQTINIGLPLTVTTTQGFGINTSLSGGQAFDLESYGGLNFTDHNRSSITGALIAIRASNNLGGDLSITTNGNVTGGIAGIFAYNHYGNDLSVTANNVSGGFAGIYVSNYYGSDLSITANNVTGVFIGISAANYYSNGSLSISSSGSVVGTLGHGIAAFNDGTSLSITANNVSGGYSGIFALNYGSGPLTVSTSGSVVSSYGQGIAAVNYGTGLTITANNVSGYYSGIIASNYGSGPLTISTSGTVTGHRWEGITAYNVYGSATEITVGPESEVRGGMAGIYAYSGSGQPITITVDGRVGNISGSPTDAAIETVGGPTAVNLNAGSHTTGFVLLDDYNDMVYLAGSLDGSVYLEGGNDTFFRAGGSVFTGVADGGSGTDTLGFGGVGTVVGSDYINFEYLEIHGGINNLTGTWNFPGGAATVYNGTLLVNGTLHTPLVTVLQDGLLGGSGTVYGNVKVYGTLSPGNSIGTFKVNGSLDFMPGSTYEVVLAASGQSDRLETTGPVSISDATLVASLRRELYQDGTSWQLISAGGGIDGRFTSIRSNFSSSTLSLSPYYKGNSMGMVIRRTPYAYFGTTPNEIEVAGALDTLLPRADGSMADLLVSMDFDMNPAQISSTLNNLSPELYTSFAPSAIAAIDTFNDIASFRQQETHYSSENLPGAPLWSVWGRALGHRRNQDGDTLYSGYTLKGEGLVLGLDRPFGDRIRAGMLLGYSSSDLSWDTLTGSGSTNGKHIALYSSGELNNFYLDGRIGYTSLDNSGTRTIVSPGFSGTASTDFDSNGINATLSGGYDFHLAGIRLGPAASLSYLHLDQDGFTDHGAGTFSVHIEDKSADVVTGSAGIRLLGLFSPGNWKLRPEAQASLVYRSWDDAEILDGYFPGYSFAGFRITGIGQDETALQAKLGLTADYSSSLSLFINGEITISDNKDAQLLSGGLVWRF